MLSVAMKPIMLFVDMVSIASFDKKNYFKIFEKYWFFGIDKW
jgi:hypothetical protein